MLRLAGVVVALCVVSWLLIKGAPELLTSENDPGKRAVDVARTRTAILAMLAGGLAAVGAYYTRRTFELNVRGQLTEGFTRAIDQLGNTGNVHIRLGGIYALERLARESSADHGPILEILTAYVRGETRLATGAATGALPESTPLVIDVQAALTVLGRRTSEYDPAQPWRLDLAGLDLRGVHLSESLLDYVDFTGCHLEDARLQGAHLNRAMLFRAHLERANLTGARLEEAKLTSAYLQKADLVATDLRGAHLEAADLTGAQLQEADLTGAHLGGADLSGANLEDADLTAAQLEGVVHSADTVWPQGFDLASWGAQ